MDTVLAFIDWIFSVFPTIKVLYQWIKGFAQNKLVAFLLAKAIVLYLAYKFLPWLLGGFYRWIYGLSSTLNLGIDFSFLNSLSSPEFTGIAAWLFLTLKLDIVFRILISAAIARLSLRVLPLTSR